MAMDQNAPLIYFESPAQWREWLAKNGTTSTEVWVGLYKKSSTKKGIAYFDSVEEALCYGWIDGLTKRVDEDSYKIRFTPRKPKGNWAATNVARAAKLIALGKMTPEGLKHVESAKLDGRWPS